LSEAPALRLELRASRVMAAVVLSAHLAGAACLAAVIPGAAGVGAGLLVILLGAVVARDRALMQAPGSVRRLELRDGAAALLELADGRQVAGTVADRRNVNRWWVTLPLQGESRRIVVVTRDMLPARDFRRLRLWALWGRLVSEATSPLAS
jgi:hypothetical protein